MNITIEVGGRLGNLLGLSITLTFMAFLLILLAWVLRGR